VTFTMATDSFAFQSESGLSNEPKEIR
jgi:hypothetical protein